MKELQEVRGPDSWFHGSCGEDPAESERRGAARHRPARPLACHLTMVGRTGEWSAVVRDLSTDGIGLLTDREFTKGTIAGVHLTNAFGSYARFLLVQIRHCIKQPDGRELLGCEFAGGLTEDEVRVFLAEPVQPAGQDGEAFVP